MTRPEPTTFVHDPTRTFEFNVLEENEWLRRQLKAKEAQVAHYHELEDVFDGIDTKYQAACDEVARLRKDLSVALQAVSFTQRQLDEARGRD